MGYGATVRGLRRGCERRNRSPERNSATVEVNRRVPIVPRTWQSGKLLDVRANTTGRGKGNLSIRRAGEVDGLERVRPQVRATQEAFMTAPRFLVGISLGLAVAGSATGQPKYKSQYAAAATPVLT